MKKTNILLVFIILLAGLLRFVSIGDVPPSPDWDETALGYNAWSIMQTGRDEYGKSLPIILRSFDDYKPALYAYLAMPSIALFGLNTPAVRMPSALFGVLTVLAVYFLVKELFTYKKPNYSPKQIEAYALISSFVVAISPWHIQFSRIAFEANIGASLTVFGLLFFFKGLKKIRYLYLSAISFALAPYVYQSEKAFMPLIGIVLVVLFFNQIRKNVKQYIGPLILFVLLAMPFYYATLTTENALLRAQGVSVFSDQTPFLEKTVSRLERDIELNDKIGLILDNRRITYAVATVRGYLSHYDLNWLFVTGDQPRHQPPDFGHLYLIELPFLLIGLYALLFSKLDRKIKIFIAVWFLIIPIPASFTTGVPHPIRTIHFIPILHILIAFGLVSVFQMISKTNALVSKSIIGLIAGLYLFNIAFFLDSYFVRYNYQSSQAWQYGYEDAVRYVQSVEDDYDSIIISSKAPLDQSYMFFLYFLKYDPEKYLAEGGTYSGGFAEENSFGKYTFREINWSDENRSDSTLYVGLPSDIPDGASIIKTIQFLDGTPAIKIAKGT